MHIARVSHLFYPDIVSDYLFELSIKQVKMGHKVDVLTWNKNKRRSVDIVIDDFIIHRLSGVNFPLDDVITDYPYLPFLPNKIAQIKPEVIHAESHLFLTTIQAIKKAKKLGIPSVVTVHGVTAKRSVAINVAQYAYLYTLGSWLFKNTSKVICLTKSDAKEVIKFGCPPEKIRVIPNAVDTNRFRPGKGRKQNLVVWIGRFVPEKGLNCLIEAAKIVAKELTNVKFVLIGYGPLKIKIMNLACKYGLLKDAVRFTGPLNRDQIAEILSKASAFVFPSLKEGLPLSLLEAMACGTPIIASNISGVNEVIKNGQNGLLVTPNDSIMLAKAIIRVLHDANLRRKLGDNARYLAIKNFSWKIVLSALESVYRDIRD